LICKEEAAIGAQAARLRIARGRRSRWGRGSLKAAVTRRGQAAATLLWF